MDTVGGQVPEPGPVEGKWSPYPSRKKARGKMGRGRWTTEEYAERHGLAIITARRHVKALVDAGIVQRIGSRPKTDDKGNVLRGRPNAVYQIPIGGDDDAG